MVTNSSSMRMSRQTLKVLDAFLENPGEAFAGANLHRRTGMASGMLYPILLRLETAGWLSSQWETLEPAGSARPRRRLYRLTSAGLRHASDVFATFDRGVLA